MLKTVIFTAALCLAIPAAYAEAPEPQLAKTYQNLAYGTEPQRTLDLYVPKGKAKAVVVYIHGGAWQKGDKKGSVSFGNALLDKGYAAAIINYGLYPQVTFPAFMYDAGAAISWLHRHLVEYGVDASPLFVVGHSAGAHMATLLVADPHYLLVQGGDPAWIKGAVGIGGIYDYLPVDLPNGKEVFGTEPPRKPMPISYVREKMPPMLLITSDSDQISKPVSTLRFYSRLRRAGNAVTLSVYHAVDHSQMTPQDAQSQSFKDMIKFIEGVTASK